MSWGPIWQFGTADATRFPGICPPRHCEPPGRANARPMTGSAKQSSFWNRKAGLLRRFAPRNDENETTELTQHRQHDHIIRMPDGALEQRILELVFEAAGRADAALGGEGAAEHGAAVGQALAAKAALDQVLNRQHAVEGAFLVQHALAVD